MTPEKQKKIKALLDNPASTENEKEICRKLLKGHPEPDPPAWNPLFPGTVVFSTPRSQASQNFWSRAQQAGQAQDAARRQQQAAGQQRREGFMGWVNSEEYQAAQRATNNYLSELARMIAEDMKGGKK
jgi:hypothetical protein